MEKIDRKKFFGSISKGVALAVFSSLIPFKLFASIKKSSDKKINIKIHPDAVKRNKVL